MCFKFFPFYIICLLAIVLPGYEELHAQEVKETLVKDIENAATVVERVAATGKLATFYYENYDEHKGDSLLYLQLQLAEAERNQQLVLAVLFHTPVDGVYNLKRSERQQHVRRWLTRALDYTRSNGLNDDMALAYCRISALELEEGNVDKGLMIANLAITTSFASVNDSVKAICALQLGNAYLARGNGLMSFKAFNNAYDLAAKNNNRLLLAVVYRAIAAMYKSLGQTTYAIDYLFRSLAIFQQAGLKYEIAEDYIGLGKLYPYEIAREYLVKAERLADTLRHKGLKVEAQKILFSYIMTKEQPQVALVFLQQHPELQKLHEHIGPHYTDWVYGEVYLYGGMPDSARRYFEKAAPYFDSAYSISQQKDFFGEMANSYFESNPPDIDQAIYYKEKSLMLSRQVSGLRDIKTISYQLGNLYQQKGDLTKALYFNRQYDVYKDSLDLLTKDKDLALLEIGNEEKRKKEAELLQQEKTNRLHNLQYMLITISVLTAFVLLLFLGIFKLSKLTIQVIGFLSFISFFEFIIMLCDTYIHHATHGEPLKIWLIKIALLSFLLPLHHYLEEKVVHYLLSKKLIETKNFVYLRKLIGWFRKKTGKSNLAQAAVVPEKEISIP